MSVATISNLKHSRDTIYVFFLSSTNKIAQDLRLVSNIIESLNDGYM